MKRYLLLLAASLPSCSGIPHGWNEAHRVPGDPLSGAWAGEWVSSVNGHRGGLQCAVEKKSAGTWEFRYRASWAKVLSAGFALEAKAVPQGTGKWLVEGSKDLGPIYGGVFKSVAAVSGDSFSARYESSADKGGMTMRRVR